ncbi:MAG TPA: hypothetical protein DHV15_03860 [Treponema sp.]|uniref:Uncharacterized protein n=1 Tax=Treponema denticola (strain ATCC 35405 / DSM 14222 / CIP 103919 / JCM 8153 / KCTC 15104) TaxID=243275 RepID=Q73M45_TREDE|nr:hypothetical protein TDE_1665 [Treponema denticola ATCC 35405]HCY94635.1 hypothetical protein [Treponema sp.]
MRIKIQKHIFFNFILYLFTKQKSRSRDIPFTSAFLYYRLYRKPINRYIGSRFIGDASIFLLGICGGCGREKIP